jgi:hypothetical protein
LPVGLTYAVEKAHPVLETTSNGVLMLSGIPIVIGFNTTLITVLFCVALVVAFLLKEIGPKETSVSIPE